MYTCCVLCVDLMQHYTVKTNSGGLHLGQATVISDLKIDSFFAIASHTFNCTHTIANVPHLQGETSGIFQNVGQGIQRPAVLSLIQHHAIHITTITAAERLAISIFLLDCPLRFCQYCILQHVPPKHKTTPE